MATRQMLIGTVFQDFFPQTVSIDLDGSTEFLANTTNNTLGIANAWSIATWIKSDATGFKNVLSLKNSGNDVNRIRIQNSSSTNLTVQLWDSAGTQRKSLQWDAQFTTGTWMHFLFTWDGTTVKVFKDGSDLGAHDSGTDNAATLTDTARRVIIGVFSDLSQTKWDGRMHSIAVWDADVGGAASAIYNGGNGEGFNLGASSGSYTFSGDLQHWWRLGFDSANIGKDSGVASTLIDVDEDSANITSDDIVADAPS